MRAAIDVLLAAISFYNYILFASVISSWLVAFNVINTRNQFISTALDFLHRITEPVLRPIRQRMPNLNGIDLSPIIAYFILYFISLVIVYYIRPNVF